MKLKNEKTQKLSTHGSIAAWMLSLCLLICCVLIGGSTPVKAQKRITSVWTATGAEGSRVTVASDVQLNDSEGYTRGDRFYVKIPKADLPSSTGSLLGRGFDDVQIQRSGDGIILSFHLQPGTTARIDQKLNRIEIVFSIPSRSAGASSRADLGEVANRTRARTIRDATGPTPPADEREYSTGSKSTPKRSAVRGATVSEVSRNTGTRDSSASRRNSPQSSTSGNAKPKALARNGSASATGNAGSTSSAPATKQPSPKASPTPNISSGSKAGVVKSPAPVASPLPSASPLSSPSPSPSPSASASAAVSSPAGTPVAGPVLVATPASQQTNANPSPSPVAAARIDWSSRLHYYKEWVRLNPIPFVIGGLAFLVLLLFLFVRGGRKRRSGVAMYKDQKRPGSRTAATPKARSTAEAAPPPAAEVGRQGRQAPSERNANAPAAKGAASEEPDREVFEL